MKTSINQINQLIIKAKALQQNQQLNAAKEIYLQILKIHPNHQDVLHLLGILHNQTGEFAKAIEYFQQVKTINPNIPQLYHNLGLAYKELGHYPQAMENFQHALKLKPDYAQVYEKLGNLYHALADYQIAIDHYQKSLELNPNDADVWSSCGNAFYAWGILSDAQQCYVNALKLKPKNSQTLLNLSHVLREFGKYAQAIYYLEFALKYDPQSAEIFCGLEGLYDQTCNWNNFEKRRAQLFALHHQTIQEKKKSPIGSLTAISLEWKPKDLLEHSQSYLPPILKQAQALKPQLNFNFSRTPKSRLKVGYISSDFHNHPVAYLTKNLYASHNRKQFEVYGFSLGATQETSIYRQHIAATVDHFIDLSLLKDLEAAQKIYDCGIDILIDLNGFTFGARPTILALRPAPIQAHYLGLLGTTGAPYMDYIIADEIVIPPATAASAYSEKPIYLPSYQIFDDQQLISDAPLSRKDYGLPEDAFVYCCFNNTYKIRPEIFSIWMEILRETPNSVLWLFGSSELTQTNLHNEAQQRGINPERIIFTKYEDRSIYLARYKLADLFLDTPYYNANTTGSDALWVGIPLITCPTQNFAGRGATSALINLDLAELITPDLAAYRQLAIKFYKQRDELEKIRNKLAANKLTQPLFKSQQFMQYLEKAYWEIWETYQRGEDPKIVKIQS